MITRIREWARRRRQAWPSVAQELGGTHHPQSRWWRNDEHITATIEGANVKLDTYVVSTGKVTVAYTRVVAPFVYGPGPKLQVYKRGILATIGKALGMEDHDLGEPAFDNAFVVKSDSAAVARRLWTPGTMKRLSGVLSDTHITGDPEEVKLVGNGRWVDPPVMIEAMVLVGELAGRDIYGAKALSAIADGRFVPGGRARPRCELDTGTRVVIAAEDRDGKLVMVARTGEPPAANEAKPAPTKGALPMATLAIENGQPTDAERAAELPQGAHVFMRSVGSGTLEDAAFVWNDLELDPARLRAGADLLGAIAVGGALYR